MQTTSVRRACSMLVLGVARAVDADYRTFGFVDWLGSPPLDGEERIGLVRGAIRVPRVIVIPGLDRVPRRTVRFARNNVFLRDGHACQYCGIVYPRGELNLDHVIPRSQGGSSTWENVVCACIRCNRRKGGRSPEEARMVLLRRPFRPAWAPFTANVQGDRRYPEWLPFLSVGEVRRERVAAGVH